MEKLEYIIEDSTIAEILGIQNFSNEESAVLAGSKGVGRFAIARLGTKACVFSKMDGQDGVLWKTDWNTNTLETYQVQEKSGTRIEIENLRDNWTESRVRNLRDFLSRTYNDDKMQIQVEYKKSRQNVTKYFGKTQLGINCVSVIRLYYSADSQTLVCDIESDEFKEEAKIHCPGMNLEAQKIEINMSDELADIKEEVSEGLQMKNGKNF